MGRGSSGLPPSPSSSQASPEGALRYLCSICHTSYTQRQGRGRHVRTVHNPNLCFLCEFRWGRPYEYRNHLQKKHPGVNPDTILGKTPGSRCRSTIITEHLSQPSPVLPPTVEQDQQNRAESQPNPLTQPSHAGARITSIPPPAVSSMSSVDHNSQPAVYALTIDEHENAHGSEFLDATCRFALLTTEERAEPMNDSGVPLQDRRFGLPSVHVGGSTATHSPSNPETAPLSTLFSPVVENYGAIVSENRPMRYSPLSDTNIDATFNSLFTNTAF